MNKEPTLYVMIGLSGAGKSTYAKFPEADVHSSDAIREELFGDKNDMSHNGTVLQVLQRRVRKSLLEGKDVVYDACNISKKRRMAVLSEFKNIPCKKVGCLILAPKDVCVKRVEKREGDNFRRDYISLMQRDFTPPHRSEGFDSITTVYHDLNRCPDFYDSLHELIEHMRGIEQNNSHHSLSVGDHCLTAAHYIYEKDPDNHRLVMAALLHDIGKLYTASNINSRGEQDGDTHYYNHHNVGAYESLLFMRKSTQLGQINYEQEYHAANYIANMVYYHMHPALSWKQSERAYKRDMSVLGEKMISDIKLLHEADVYAHMPQRQLTDKEIEDVFLAVYEEWHEIEEREIER